MLFDLDGTLADTAAELADATNAVRGARGLAPLGLSVLRPHVSGGARALLAAGLDMGTEHPDYATARAALLEHYGAHLGRRARLFDGMAQVLETLARRGIGWGIVTNKPRVYAVPLIEALGLGGACRCLLTPDDVPRAKPDPHGTLAACAALGADPAQTVFVGDDARDIQAGRAAGTRTAAALWGYLPPGCRAVEWGADLLCPSPAQLEAWIGRACEVC